VFAGIKNFAEQLVFARMQETLIAQGINDEDFLEDVACLALNQLPPRYIRFSVDLVVNLDQDERDQLEEDAADAVRKAVDIVTHRRAQREND
jgi:hypothetical protein